MISMATLIGIGLIALLLAGVQIIADYKVFKHRTATCDMITTQEKRQYGVLLLFGWILPSAVIVYFVS